MKVLVTGGGGFLGRYIVDMLLERGHRVRVLGRKDQPDLKARGVDVYRADIADTLRVNNAIFDVDTVFHVAAKAGICGTWDSYYKANVVGTRNVLKACETHGVENLIYTSTPSVVFNGQPFHGADENQPYGKNWLCHYAHTKRIAEEELLAANNSKTLRTIALRPHLIWGVGDQHLLPRILARAKSGKLRIIGDGSNLVDFTHVKNAAHAHMLAFDAILEGNACGNAYFISDGAPVNLWGWVNELLKSAGLPKAERHLPFSVAYRLGALFEMAYKIFRLNGEPPMTRFLATELAKSHYFSIANAQKDLGYTPIANNEEGLRELAETLHSAT